MKYFSLFSGIGGFEYGIRNALLRQKSNGTRRETKNIQGSMPNISPKNLEMDAPCVGFSEIDKYAIQIYRKHYPNHKEYGDVTNIKWSDVPDFELLCGGFPCQSFSIAGKRGGFSDTRGTLFFEITRVAQEKHPRLLLLENVKGLLSHDKGHTFGTILNTLDELGYDLQWQVLNSKNFGVPQNRERIFIIGHLRTTPRPQVFPLQQANKIHSGDNNRKIAKCLDSNYHKGWLDHGQRTMITVPMRWVRTEKGKAFRREAQKRGRDLTPFNDGYRELVEAKELVVGCITNALQKDTLLKHGTKIRRLTPTECERLQGFPDGWTEKGIDLKGNETLISDTQRYKCLGNAVSCPVITAIAERLL